MESKAQAKMVRISSRKVKLVIDLVRGKTVGEAFNILAFTPKAQGRASQILKRTSHITAVVAEKE